MVSTGFRRSPYPGVHTAETFQGKGIEKRLFVTEMLAGRRVAHAQVTGKLPQRKTLHSCFFNAFRCTREQRFAEPSVMVGLIDHVISLAECSH